MPTDFTREDRCIDIHESVVCDSTKLLLVYDGSGRRISKTSLTKTQNAANWDTIFVTHYTGFGTEVCETHVNGQDETKVVVNMPQGLGRYTPEDAVDGFNGVGDNQRAGYRPPAKFEWYLKNHLGSTMLVYGTSAYNDPLNSGYKGGVKAAYDYHAFGEQLILVEPTDKVTENFTGKGIRGERCDSRVYLNWHCRAEEHCARRNEKDDEIELNYFGARYLDPMLGMWVSMDPARQYQNPYLYAGNNPVMRTDPDGNADEINQNILQDFFSGMFAFFNFKGQQTLDNVCETAAPYMEGVRKIYQVGAVFDPEPISRWGFSVGTIAFDTFDAFAEEGGGCC